jgi:DNA polymerase-1
MAVNTVIQGTAADLIKRAMVDVDRALAEAGLGAQMILQVHDELVVEVDRPDVAAIAELVQRVMEGAAELSVPLETEVCAGPNWDDLTPLPELAVHA